MLGLLVSPSAIPASTSDVSLPEVPNLEELPTGKPDTSSTDPASNIGTPIPEGSRIIRLPQGRTVTSTPGNSCLLSADPVVPVESDSESSSGGEINLKNLHKLIFTPTFFCLDTKIIL